MDEALWEYHGQQNERAAGVKIKPEDRIEKPEALIRYEQAASLGVPYVEGGLMDQPWLWMQEHRVVQNYLAQKEAIAIAQAASQSK